MVHLRFDRPFRFVPSALVMPVCLLVGANFFGSLQADERPATKLLKVKVVRWTGSQEKSRTIVDAQLVVTSGRSAEVRFAGDAATDPTTALEVKLDSAVGGNPQRHLVACRITQSNANGEPTVLAAPKLVVTEGSRGSIQIGNNPGDGIEMSLVVEPVNP